MTETPYIGRPPKDQPENRAARRRDEAKRRKLLATRERDANRQLADAAHQCAERLRCVTALLDRQIDELDLPAQQHSLAVIGAALLRIEQEAQRQLPWLCRDGGRR
jgi:hypothetical protein